LLLLVGLGLIVGLVPNGAQFEPYRQIMILTLAVPLSLALLVRVDGRATARALAWTLVCAVLVVGWAVIQTLHLPAGLPGHPVWDEIAALGLDAGRYLSVAPAATRDALPVLILPFAVFAAVLILCQSRDEALFAWTMLMVIGWALFALAVALELFFPEVRFFSDFAVGRGAFSGFLVNRNLTASFLGMLAFVTAASLMRSSPGAGSDTGRDGMIPGLTRAQNRQYMIGLVLFLIVIGILATRSRAGSTLAILILSVAAAIYLVLHSAPGATGKARGFTTRQKATMAIAVGVAVYVVFGEQVFTRLETAEDDLRWCAWMVMAQAIAERPIAGSGFGNFAAYFPQYRDPECMGTGAAWTRAHNSYLEVVADMGVVGPAGVAIGLWALMRTFWVGITMRRSLRAIPVFAVGCLAFVALHSAVDFPLQIPGLASYFAAVMGVACAVSLLDRPERRRRSTRSGTPSSDG
jgi:hypothetical protein